MPLKVGDRVPEFELPDQNGRLFNIGSLLGIKPIVIYFYPKDDSPGCTAEACSFRDQFEDFKALGAEVIGISTDTIEQHKRFAAKHRLPFILLSDARKKARNLFGVPKNFFGLIPGRVTYVVDEKGIINHIFDSQINAVKHVSEALKALKN